VDIGSLCCCDLVGIDLWPTFWSPGVADPYSSTLQSGTSSVDFLASNFDPDSIYYAEKTLADFADYTLKQEAGPRVGSWAAAGFDPEVDTDNPIGVDGSDIVLSSVLYSERPAPVEAFDISAETSVKIPAEDPMKSWLPDTALFTQYGGSPLAGQGALQIPFVYVADTLPTVSGKVYTVYAHRIQDPQLTQGHTPPLTFYVGRSSESIRNLITRQLSTVYAVYASQFARQDLYESGTEFAFQNINGNAYGRSDLPTLYNYSGIGLTGATNNEKAGVRRQAPFLGTSYTSISWQNVGETYAEYVVDPHPAMESPEQCHQVRATKDVRQPGNVYTLRNWTCYGNDGLYVYQVLTALAGSVVELSTRYYGQGVDRRAKAYSLNFDWPTGRAEDFDLVGDWDGSGSLIRPGYNPDHYDIPRYTLWHRAASTAEYGFDGGSIQPVEANTQAGLVVEGTDTPNPDDLSIATATNFANFLRQNRTGGMPFLGRCVYLSHDDHPKGVFVRYQSPVWAEPNVIPGSGPLANGTAATMRAELVVGVVGSHGLELDTLQPTRTIHSAQTFVSIGYNGAYYATYTPSPTFQRLEQDFNVYAFQSNGNNQATIFLARRDFVFGQPAPAERDFYLQIDNVKLALPKSGTLGGIGVTSEGVPCLPEMLADPNDHAKAPPLLQHADGHLFPGPGVAPDVRNLSGITHLAVFGGANEAVQAAVGQDVLIFDSIHGWVLGWRFWLLRPQGEVEAVCQIYLDPQGDPIAWGGVVNLCGASDTHAFTTSTNYIDRDEKIIKRGNIGASRPDVNGKGIQYRNTKAHGERA
jgi:hypothetical protein